jgi:hypothetical protein
MFKTFHFVLRKTQISQVTNFVELLNLCFGSSSIFNAFDTFWRPIKNVFSTNIFDQLSKYFYCYKYICYSYLIKLIDVCICWCLCCMDLVDIWNIFGTYPNISSLVCTNSFCICIRSKLKLKEYECICILFKILYLCYLQPFQICLYYLTQYMLSSEQVGSVWFTPPPPHPPTPPP